MQANFMLIAGAIAVFSCGALAEDGHGNGNSNTKTSSNSAFESSVIGSTPGQSIAGVLSGGLPWVVGQGEASVSSDGRVRVELRGLLLGGPGTPANLAGTTGPITMVGASLVCGGSGGTVVGVADTAISPSPLSSLGNAEIQQAVTLPANCIAPVVLVRIFNSTAALGSQLGSFIAATGLMPGAAQTQTQNDGEHENEGHGGRH